MEMDSARRSGGAARSPLADFEATLREDAHIRAALAGGIIGKDTEFDGPFGRRRLVYADYVASGRALVQVERFVLDRVLPFYANSHTEASYCGAAITRMRAEARRIILDKCGGRNEDHAVVFTGSGATAGLNKLVELLGVRDAVADGRKPCILIGPYEHHSNILPWRDSGAEVIEIAEAPSGGPDLDHLREVLTAVRDRDVLVGAFSAASNVTGIWSDVLAVSRQVKEVGGKVVWDYAGAAPYLTMDMSPDGVDIDAIVFSPHKFVGGPAASGVLIVRRDAVVTVKPSRPGGGTVAFVNNEVHDYLTRIEDREEGGTPNVVGDIRAALAVIVKDAIGQDFITERNRTLVERALAAWGAHPDITLLGGIRTDRLPIFSLRVKTESDAVFDYKLFTRALSDIYGIQARGGCSCAGPYVHRLLDIDPVFSSELRREILAGDESRKPGFVRLNLSVLMSDAEVDFVLSSVAELAADYRSLAGKYASVTVAPVAV